MQRFEWKYRVPPELVPELTDALRPCTEPDPHCLTATGGAYPVRSLYYDTPDLRFYHEKKDGLKVRRKLRVRSYGGDLCFLEIKRKINGRVLKERVSLGRSELAAALDGVDPVVAMTGRPDSDLRTLERFRFNLRSLGLIPTVLISYRRGALTGRLEPGLRITLDSDLRSRAHPDQDALFEDAGPRPFEDRSLLELKFDGHPPHWLMGLVSEFRLRREPYSKYCEGIDRWADPSGPIGGAPRNGAAGS